MKRLIYTVFACILISGSLNFITAQQPDLKSFNALIDSCDVNLRLPHKPLIGISIGVNDKGRLDMSNAYVISVLKAGGSPVLIPMIEDGATLRSIVANLDGVVLTGGEDVNPVWYKEEPNKNLQETNTPRDRFELTLIKLASDRNIPILGICRGEQLLNVAFGGTLYQDIPSQKQNALKHLQTLPGKEPSHSVTIKQESQLHNIIDKDSMLVNSFHHQGIKDVASCFNVTAIAKDGQVEAIEAWPNHPIIAVQWHPEAFTAAGDTTMLKLFKFIVGKAETFYLAKEMHKHFLSVDTHTDTPLWFDKAGFNIADREKNRVNIPKMEEGRLDGVFLAAFIWQGKRDETSLQKAVEETNQLIENIHKQAENNKDLCGIATTPEEFAQLKAEGKKAFFIGIENGYGIGKDLKNIARFKSKGVNYITLCHSYDNDICDSSTKTKREWKGLSPFGKEVVKEMNRQGVMIDMSHASEESFYDVIKLTKTPIICSHSSSRAICDNDRNLTDDQLRALAKNGGVAQVCLLDAYINKDEKKACIDDVIQHIDHMVKVAGIDHVGVGSDFDGGGGVIGCEADNDFIQITVKLIERGYTEQDLSKIWGGNLLRVLKTVQNAATVNK